MKRYLIKVLNVRHSELIQKELFRIGFTWIDGKDIQFTDKEYIFAYEQDRNITYSDSPQYSASTVYNRITLDELICLDKLEGTKFEIGKYYGAFDVPMFKIFKYMGKTSTGFGSSHMFSVTLNTKKLADTTLQDYGYEPRSEKQWIDELIKEAERKGLGTCVRFNNVSGYPQSVAREDIIKPYYEGGEFVGLVRGDGTGMLYIRGEWATRLEAEKPPELPEILGYVGNDKGDTITYGCLKFDKAWLATDEFKTIEKLVIKGEGGVSNEKLQQLSAYLAKNPGCDDTTEW